MTWRERVWFFDTEVLPNDWLFCALSIDGQRVSFRNDNVAVVQWVQENKPLLCGYNSKHYDAYILKAIYASASPQDVKKVSDAIIVDGMQGWEIDMGYVPLPDMFDLMLDLPTRPSLKMIEGNLHMDIQESSVSFDNAHPTQEEWKELERYCWHDVEALLPLYKAREGYLEAKETLAEMRGIPVEKALNMTNAKLTALFLGAKRVERNDERDYVYPDNLKKEYIPKQVFEFFDRLPNSDIPLDILFGKEGVPDENGKVVKSRNPYRSLSIDIAGCPSVIGWGGIHGSLDIYVEKTTQDRVILNVDVQSYYPSLMLENGYLSRNVTHPQIFRNAYEERIEAKNRGDEKTADALKLPLNTTYGASNNKYNDLYDPLMAHSICITGQLYLIQLAEELHTHVPTIRFIQLNTDGVMFSVDREHLSQVRDIIHKWEEQTRMVMEEEEIDVVIQRDVNNYVLKNKTKDEIKAKGGVVSDWKGGDFKHNSLSVVCRALVSHFIDNTSIEDTIMGENNPFAFQMIAKAGRSFERVIHEIDGMEFQVNRVNRIYAGKDESLGSVYKIKEGNRHKVPNCPEHAIVDNEGTIGIDKIDKTWYIKLAQERANEFIYGKRRKKKMPKKKEEELEVVIEDDSKEKKVEKKVEKKPTKKTPTFNEKLFQLAEDVAEMASQFVKDGYNPSQSYEYVRAQQYKSIFRKALKKNRLRHKVDDAMAEASQVLRSDKMVLTSYHAVLTIIDVDSEDNEKYMLWSQGADNLDKGLSKAKTLALKDFIKVNYLVSDQEDDPEGDTGATTSVKKFTKPEEAKRTAEKIVKDEEKATEEQIERIKTGIANIRDYSGDASYGAKTLTEVKKGITSSRAEVILTKLEMKAGEYNLEV